MEVPLISLRRKEFFSTRLLYVVRSWQVVLFAGQGDARRSMSLLWRTKEAKGGQPAGKRSAPGPKPALSVDAIVDAGIALADAEGLSALSMRAVGARLGRTAMALYTYVPSKSELLDLMYDR